MSVLLPESFVTADIKERFRSCIRSILSVLVFSCLKIVINDDNFEMFAVRRVNKLFAAKLRTQELSWSRLRFAQMILAINGSLCSVSLPGKKKKVNDD